MKKPGIGIIGSGRVGKAFGVHLARAGWRIAGVHDIDPEKAAETARVIPTGVFDDIGDLAHRADILFLSVPDSEIALVAENIGELEYVRARFLFHFSGILPSRILLLAGMDRAVYSLHPFGGISPDSSGENPFAGLYFSGEGDNSARPIALRITASLGGKFIEIDAEKKASYHLAASLLANHMFALLSAGERLLRESGLPEKEISPMIYELVGSAFANYRKFGPKGGLTGPIVRGDELTIAEHLVAAERAGLRDLYEAGLRELRAMLFGD